MKISQPTRALLYPLGVLYGWAVGIRGKLYDSGVLRPRKLQSAVVSVGNVTMGGTGKTPMVLWLAEKFLAEGKRVGILSRGYRGANGTSDEVELLKNRLAGRVEFGVGPDRFANGRALEQRTPIDILLLDDGFQHRQLARDLDIVMLDGSRKLREQSLLPAGELREPASGCNRADIIIVSREFGRPAIEGIDTKRQAVFYSHTRLLGFRRFAAGNRVHALGALGSGPFFGFCGIGNPRAFFADLERWQLPLAEIRAFRDHHKYTPADVHELLAAATAAGAPALVTTEKDSYNLPPDFQYSLPIWIAVIDVAVTDESELLALIERKLRGRPLPQGAPA
jgi:tetraacyldisaccharide 4'-kinase